MPIDEGGVANLVAQVSAEVAARMTATRKTRAKNLSDVDNFLKVAPKGTMKWLPFVSSFIL
jgi:hypothetical protein